MDVRAIFILGCFILFRNGLVNSLIRGRHVCYPENEQFPCCPGWKQTFRHGPCLTPICNPGCIGGVCVEPSLCLCRDGTTQPNCEYTEVNFSQRSKVLKPLTDYRGIEGNSRSTVDELASDSPSAFQQVHFENKEVVATNTPAFLLGRTLHNGDSVLRHKNVNPFEFQRNSNNNWLKVSLKEDEDIDTFSVSKKQSETPGNLDINRKRNYVASISGHTRFEPLEIPIIMRDRQRYTPNREAHETMSTYLGNGRYIVNPYDLDPPQMHDFNQPINFQSPSVYPKLRDGSRGFRDEAETSDYVFDERPVRVSAVNSREHVLSDQKYNNRRPIENNNYGRHDTMSYSNCHPFPCEEDVENYGYRMDPSNYPSYLNERFNVQNPMSLGRYPAPVHYGNVNNRYPTQVHNDRYDPYSYDYEYEALDYPEDQYFDSYIVEPSPYETRCSLGRCGLLDRIEEASRWRCNGVDCRSSRHFNNAPAGQNRRPTRPTRQCLWPWCDLRNPNHQRHTIVRESNPCNDRGIGCNQPPQPCLPDNGCVQDRMAPCENGMCGPNCDVIMCGTNCDIGNCGGDIPCQSGGCGSQTNGQVFEDNPCSEGQIFVEEGPYRVCKDMEEFFIDSLH